MIAKSWLTALSLLSCAWLPGVALAEPLRVDRSAEKMRVDGSLREWKGARFNHLGDGNDAAVRYALASVDEGVYVATEVSDDVLVRASGVGTKQDAVVLTLVMPTASGVVSTEVWLHPGQAGRSKAAAGIAQGGRAPKAEPRVQVVEGPRERGAGYVVEAFVPFAVVAGSEIWEQGRGALRFEDVDKNNAAPESTLRSAQAKRDDELPKLALGTGQNDFIGAFASSKGLTGVELRYDFRADVSGDAEPERVAILDKYVLVYGKHYKRGETYGYYAMPYGMGGGLVSAELLDVTNDGRAELLLRVRQRNQLGGREVFMVVSLAEENIAPAFSIEVKKESKGGFIETSLSLDKKAKPVRIRVQPGRSQGLDALTYQEDPARDAEPILLPWGDTVYRVYAHDGGKYSVVDEQKRAPEKPSASMQSSERLNESQPKPLLGAESTPVTSLDLLDQFKRLQQIERTAAPERQLKANLMGGSKEEQVFTFGSKLVIIGPDVGGGASYLGFGLPVATAQDLLYLGAADVTGDGLRELMVRVRQPLSGGATPVTRELLMVLRVEASPAPGKLNRLLLVEVVRRQDKNAIVNTVRSEQGKLIIEPGQATGFTQASYPYNNEPTGGAERLLLPWLDKPVRYRFDGTRLLPE